MATNVNNTGLSTARFNNQKVNLIRVNGVEVWSFNRILLKKVDTSDYTFTNVKGFEWVSNNSDVDESTARGDWQIMSNTDRTYGIQVIVSSEEGYDELYVWFDGQLILSGLSGEDSEYYLTVNLQANTIHTISAEYRKDVSVSEGSDNATLVLPCNGTLA